VATFGFGKLPNKIYNPDGITISEANNDGTCSQKVG